MDRVGRQLRTNPGIAFITGFEILLIGAAVELWMGNGKVADELGIVGFILALAGVAFQTIVSVRAKSKTTSTNSLS